MVNTLKLEIVTPDAVVYSEDVEMVTLQGVEGQMGIYPQHVRLMTQLVPGEMIVHKGGRDDFLAVGEGLVEITNDRVAIVTDMAVAAENIDEARAEEARQRAAARLQEKLSSQDLASVNATLTRSLAQLSVKRRHRRPQRIGADRPARSSISKRRVDVGSVIEDLANSSYRARIIRIALDGADQKKHHLTIIARTINSVPVKRNFSGRVLYFGHLKTP